jgi:hypothetical protein
MRIPKYEVGTPGLNTVLLGSTAKDTGVVENYTVNDILGLATNDNTLTFSTVVVQGNGAYTVAEEKIQLYSLTWSGSNGTMGINLPLAANSSGRMIRFVTDGSMTNGNNTLIKIAPVGSDTLDGEPTPYDINKKYEGVAIWSNGVEWFIIQKKA